MSRMARWMVPFAAVLLAALVGWAWRPEGWSVRPEPLARVLPQQAVSIEIRGGPVGLVLQREGDAWFQKEPFRQAADLVAIRQLLAAASDAAPVYRLPMADIPVAARMEEPVAELSITLVDGGRRTWLIGAGHPAGLAWIAERTAGQGGPASPELRRRVLDALAGAMLEARLFELAGAESDRIEATVRTPDGIGTLRLERGPTGWRLGAPVDTRADGEAVKAWLEALGRLRSQGSSGPMVGDGAMHGLSDPVALVRVRTLDPATGLFREESVRVGGDNGSGGRFVQVQDRPVVEQLAAESLPMLVPPAMSLVDGRAVPVAPERVHGIRVLDQTGLPMLELARQSDASWARLGTQGPEPVHDRAVRELLRALCETRATAISADEPDRAWLEAEVALTLVDGVEAPRLRIWRLPDGRWAMGDGDGPVRVHPAELVLPLSSSDHPPKR
ncbi:MAG: DUF4340 domain-containing protein [Phycisphaerales bacterium]|jgi:hypothetical protein